MSRLSPKFSASVGGIVIVAFAVAVIGAGCGGEDAAAEAADQAAAKVALAKEFSARAQEAASAGDASAEATAAKAFADSEDAFQGASSSGASAEVKAAEAANADAIRAQIDASAAGAAPTVHDTVVSGVNKVLCIEANSAQNKQPPPTAQQWEAAIVNYIHAELGYSLSAQIVNALYQEIKQRINQAVTAINAMIRADPTHRSWYLQQLQASLQC